MARLVKILRSRCQWGDLVEGASCRREANYQVGWITKKGSQKYDQFCYRHRWRAREMLEETERANAPAEERRVS